MNLFLHSLKSRRVAVVREKLTRKSWLDAYNKFLWIDLTKLELWQIIAGLFGDLMNFFSHDNEDSLCKVHGVEMKDCRN